jgi:hypothetical protein
VVTFHPDTQHAGFLVPIDRCVALAKAGIYAAPGALASGNGVAGPADKAHEAHYKEQARGVLGVVCVCVCVCFVRSMCLLCGWVFMNACVSLVGR